MISKYESTIGADDAWKTNEEQSQEDTASRLGAGAEANAEAEAVHGSEGWRCAGPKEEVMGGRQPGEKEAQNTRLPAFLYPLDDASHDQPR